MKKLSILFFALLILGALGEVNRIYADGCYTCGSGSSENCKHYCRYSGSDTFENRKKCEKAGCKITGTASCPTASNYKVCSALSNEKTIYERFAYNYLKKYDCSIGFSML
jgi:hypothetical protein